MLVIFSPFLYWIKRRFDLKEKALEAGNPVDQKLLAEVTDERKLLAERIENLESIVYNTDYELNARIARLAAEQSRLKALESASSDPASKQEADASSPKNPDSEGQPGAQGSEAIARTLTAPGLRRDQGRDDSDAVYAAVAGTTEFSTGEVLANRYRIVRPLGRGGMGAVYLAEDEVLGEEVALKVISSSWSHDQRAMIDRFRREASAARKVSSPNVIRIHDLGEESRGLLYLSMEYFAGETLARVMSDRGKFGKHDTHVIVGQVCDGLEAAHKAGVVHRDLKPQNVLVGAKDVVKLIDFGLAKSTFTSGMTATGLMMGTPYYMSPEQIRGKDVDARADIYALGALTYHAVTGQPPFDAENPIAICFAHLSEQPTPPRDLNSNISRKLASMIVAALAKDPRDRPQSAREFRGAI